MIESKYLKDDMKNIQQLFRLPAFKSFEIRELSKLLRLCKIRQYDGGEIIIKEGDVDHWLYFLLSGKVNISKNGVNINLLKKKGDLFGEMRLIDGLSRSASAYSVGKTICLAIDIAAKHRLAFDDEISNLLLLLYRSVAEFISIRLRLSNEELIRAKKEVLRLKNTQLSRTESSNDSSLKS